MLIFAVAVGLVLGAGIGFVVGRTTASSKASSRSRASTSPSRSAASSPSDLAVNGAVTIADIQGYSDATSTDNNPGDSCVSSGGYDDIAEGAQVVISDDTGRTLSIVSLDAGTISSEGCRFTFSANVPAGRGFYGVTVSHRGLVKEAEADMADVELTIGG